MCDCVLQECENISSQLRKYRWFKQSTMKTEDVIEIIYVLKENFPEFSAARFFKIERSTIFHMLYCISTFFIVMLQFRQ